MTPNFSKEELACRCGCGMLPQQSFMDKVQKLRDLYRKPLPVHSAARCPAYNAQVSKTGTTGPHTTGRAIDLGVRGSDAHELLALAFIVGFGGIGVNQTGTGRFLHLDDLPDAPGCPRPTVWSY